MRVLIVDDDAALAANLATGLGRAGMAATVVSDPSQSDLVATARTADAVILDVMLGAADGLEISQHLRSHGVGTPILMLTARESVADRVRGLDAGADDYLTKPFALEELLARVRALGRRAGDGAGDELLHVGDLVVDLSRHEVTRAEKAIELTAREFDLLVYLMR